MSVICDTSDYNTFTLAPPHLHYNLHITRNVVIFVETFHGVTAPEKTCQTDQNMQFVSTNHSGSAATLQQAMIQGTAPDGGLYVPAEVPVIPDAFFRNIAGMPPVDIAYVVANTLLGGDLDPETVRDTVTQALSFTMPIVSLPGEPAIMELFHGPTLSVKDIGARFMAALLQRFRRPGEPLHIMAATSGDAGSAVAHAFSHCPDTRITILYPRGRLTSAQMRQLALMAPQVETVEVRGSFTDCQALVKTATVDPELAVRPVTANSINVARFLPQTFHFFNAYARMVEAGAHPDRVVIAVPSGNLGNLAAGLLARRMGLPVKRIVAATNANDCFVHYLAGRQPESLHAIPTLANAMDTSMPTNLPRVKWLEAQGAITPDSLTAIAATDADITEAIRALHTRHGYTIDPHGACAYHALTSSLRPGEEGLLLATAHPDKCPEAMATVLGDYTPQVPADTPRYSHPLTIPPSYGPLKRILTKR